jgi:hypothetical protein
MILAAELREVLRRALRRVLDLPAALEALERQRRRFVFYRFLFLPALSLPWVGALVATLIRPESPLFVLGFVGGVTVLVIYLAGYSRLTQALTTALRQNAVAPALRVMGFQPQGGAPRDAETAQRDVLLKIFPSLALSFSSRFLSPRRELQLNHLGLKELGAHKVYVTHVYAAVRGKGWVRTLFLGPVASASCPDGQEILVVREMGVLGVLEDLKRGLTGLQRVELSDPSFEALYSVYARTEAAAAALRPALRDALVQLARDSSTRPLVAFRDGWVHVFIPHQGFLTPHRWARVSEDRLISDLEALLQATLLAAVAAGASPAELLASLRESTA